MGTYGTDLAQPARRVQGQHPLQGHRLDPLAGAKLIVFVKGYAAVTRKVEGKNQTLDDVVYQMKKEIKPTADWQPFSLDFELRPMVTFTTFSTTSSTCACCSGRIGRPVPAVTTTWAASRRSDRSRNRKSATRKPSRQRRQQSPRLGPTGEPSPTSADTQPAAADDAQLFLDAANAFNDGDAAQCRRTARSALSAAFGPGRVSRTPGPLPGQGIALDPEPAARGPVLLDHPVEPWQYDWGGWSWPKPSATGDVPATPPARPGRRHRRIRPRPPGRRKIPATDVPTADATASVKVGGKVRVHSNHDAEQPPAQDQGAAGWNYTVIRRNNLFTEAPILPLSTQNGQKTLLERDNKSAWSGRWVSL